jgi:hypothetical protein
MIAMQLTYPDSPRRPTPGRWSAAIGQHGERASILAADGLAAVSAQFQPLDPGIVNEAIPAFFIGRNKEGFWVARDVNGQIGGIFVLENSALSFARRHSEPNGCATIYPSERFELDLENRGNPLVEHLASLTRFARDPRQQIAASMRNLTEAVKRRLRDFQIP